MKKRSNVAVNISGLFEEDEENVELLAEKALKDGVKRYALAEYAKAKKGKLTECEEYCVALEGYIWHILGKEFPTFYAYMMSCFLQGLKHSARTTRNTIRTKERRQRFSTSINQRRVPRQMP